MLPDLSLVNSVNKVLKKVVLAPIVRENEILRGKLLKPMWEPPIPCYIIIYSFNIFRIRAQDEVASTPTISIGENEGAMAPLLDEEIKHCAAVIAAAFLNPGKLNYDWNLNLFWLIIFQSMLIGITKGLPIQPQSAN